MQGKAAFPLVTGAGGHAACQKPFGFSRGASQAREGGRGQAGGPAVTPATVGFVAGPAQGQELGRVKGQHLLPKEHVASEPRAEAPQLLRAPGRRRAVGAVTPLRVLLVCCFQRACRFGRLE